MMENFIDKVIYKGPPSGPFDPFEIGNYSWSDSLLWITAFIGLLVGTLLLVSWFTTRKKHILLWAFSFLGIWIFYHVMSASGSYIGLI